MFDFSFAEIALIIVVCVIFIRPEDVPAIIRTVAKAIRSVKSLSHEVKAAFDEMAKESGLKEAAESFDNEMKMIQGDDGKMYESYPIPKAPIPKADDHSQ